MYYIRYSGKTITCNTAVCDITYHHQLGRIEFIPFSDLVESFYIDKCSPRDYDIILSILRDTSFINLDTLGYNVLFD